MIKPPLRKVEQTPYTLILFLALITLSYFCTTCVVFPKFEHDVAKTSILTCFVLGMFFMALAWLKDPGFLKQDEDLNFMSLLQQFEPNCLCPDCEVIRTPRSRHCNICKRCVDRFDHHCPWINNCVGVNNHHVFYLFLLFILAYLL
jgi:DHHC palmitoyltransferase